MSNAIVEQFFSIRSIGPHIETILKTIAQEINFKPQKELFRGKIYEDNKVGSVLIEGKWKNKKAVLKIQGLPVEIEEANIIQAFDAQNQSTWIRLPKVFKHRLWTKTKGYGYTLMEAISGKPLYVHALASPSEMQDFIRFYTEYKTQALKKPLFKKNAHEHNAFLFTHERIKGWKRIAEAQKINLKENEELIKRFLKKAEQILKNTDLEFQHGHLSRAEVLLLKNGDHVILGNLFWSYRIPYYDTTFHLWAGLKEIRDLDFTSRQAIDTVEQWRDAYKAISFIQNDPRFDVFFNLTLMERCVGAALLDLENQNYEADRGKHVHHLRELFKAIAEHLTLTKS